MEILGVASYLADNVYKQFKKPHVRRDLSYGSKVALEGARYTVGNIPRALAWAVPNAFYTGVYPFRVVGSLAVLAYNKVRGYEHWDREHLVGDDRMRRLGEIPKWSEVWDEIPGPDWHAPDYPDVDDPDKFDPDKKYTGLAYTSTKNMEARTLFISNAMFEDAKSLSHLIRTDVFPALMPDGTPHPKAGKLRYRELSQLFDIAALVEEAEQ